MSTDRNPHIQPLKTLEPFQNQLKPSGFISGMRWKMVHTFALFSLDKRLRIALEIHARGFPARQPEKRTCGELNELWRNFAIKELDCRLA